MDGVFQQAKAMGYSDYEIRIIPIDAIFELGCGNTNELAGIKTGETILGLGSGG